MNSAQREQIEKRLLSERARAVRVVERLDEDARSAAAGDGDLTRYPLHLADEGTDAMQKEKELLLLSTEGRQLYEINEALRRLYRSPEQFGRCERCGRAIEFARLDLLPWARYCVDCKTLEENGG
jgi:RNA polymerase-binding transcription factor DksA